MAVMARERRLVIPRERVRGPDRGMAGKAIVYVLIIVGALCRAVRLDGLRLRPGRSATSSAGRRSGSRATRRSTTTLGSSSINGSTASSSTAPTWPSPSPSSNS